MKKIIINFLFTIKLTIILCNKLFAEITFSGYQEFFTGSADQSRQTGVDTSTGINISNSNFSGFSNGSYTRLVATANSTLDNGVTVIGTYSVMKDQDNGADSDVESVSTDQNDIVLSGIFGTIAFGNTGSAGTIMHNRATTIPPTAEPDGAVIGHFYTAGAGTYGAHDEAGYANDAMKIRFQSNVYEGFSFGISHTPNLNADTANASQIDQNACSAADTTGHACYTDLTDLVISYSTDIDGISISGTYGYQTGNVSVEPTSGTITGYNDLEGNLYTLALSYGGATIHYKYNDMEDSGVAKTTLDAGNTEGSALCGLYTIGNFSIGGCDVETSYSETAQSIDNESTTRLIGVGYNLGGGVNLEAAYAMIEEKDNGVVDTDVDLVITKLSFGF